MRAYATLEPIGLDAHMEVSAHLVNNPQWDTHAAFMLSRETLVINHLCRRNRNLNPFCKERFLIVLAPALAGLNTLESKCCAAFSLAKDAPSRTFRREDVVSP